ncbi:MAG: HAMP domain-containing methyl-accepting chemotaxis protein [Rhodocyclaceae bacterium]|nr:HAMP domain-containing methyl-accepting chemotaxis protein [Rhodocyclaceae bacterium]
MKTLFKPGMHLMRRLRYPAKFGVAGAIMLVMVAFLFVSLVGALYGEIRMARGELAGLPVAEKVLQVVRLTQQHRGLSSAVLNGGENLKPKLQGLTTDLEAGMAMARDTLAANGQLSAANGRWEKVLSDWGTLRTKGLEMPARDNIVAHTRLVGLQLLALHDIGDDAGLSRDPQTDTAYLLDNALRRIPTVTERLGRLRALGAGALAAQALDEQRREDITLQLGELQSALDDLRENLDRSAQANPAAKPRIMVFRTALDDSTGPVLVALREHILKSDLSMAPAAYFDLVTGTIDQAYERTFQELLPQTRGLLELRLAGLERAAIGNVSLCLLCLVTLLYLGISAYLTVVESVGELRSVAEEMARGNLRADVRFSARDELRTVADSFGAMAVTLRDVIGELHRETEALTRSASSLVDNASRVSRASESQSEAAAGTAAAVEEMTVGVEEIARHAGSAEEISRDSGRLSESGGEVVARTVVEMQSIAQVVRESAQVIEELGARSGEISVMVSTIQQIADQTNLLALNAAIEAARAGEQGRGFAVVADEVRKLAERTSLATREISAVINGIQAGTGRAVATMQQGVERVQQGVALTSEAGASMGRIREGSSQVVQAVSDISLALREQSSASNEIARNVERIARMAEENSLAVNETAATANQLEGLAARLRQQVARFQV